LRAINASTANLREAFEQKLRHIPILGGVSAVGAALGVVALLVGVIGVHAVYNTNKEVRALEAGANRAIFAERANSLVYAVVMDSRGIYMSSKATDRANYGAGVMKFLAELDADMAAWKEHVTPEDREDFVRAQARPGVHPVQDRACPAWKRGRGGSGARVGRQRSQSQHAGGAQPRN
jgi:hypothetical protein